MNGLPSAPPPTCPRLSRLMVSLALAASLAACVSQPRRDQRPPLTSQQFAAAEAAQQARQAQLSTLVSWSLSGRVALATGRNGGSGRIEWQQKDPLNYAVTLNAPVSRQSWRLSGNRRNEAGRLEGLDGGPREGADAESLLLEATGWYLPVNQMPAWLLGLPSDEAEPALVDYGPDGRLAVIEQAGWRIEYLEWVPALPAQPELPRRIVATRGDAKVRLIVDEWTLDAAAAPHAASQ